MQHPMTFNSLPVPDYTATPHSPPAPAATGTMAQAWASIGRRPARATIAGWSQASPAQWTTQSIIVGAVLAAVAALIGGIIAVARGASVLTPGTYVNTHSATIGIVLGSVVGSSLGFIITLFIVAYALAMFMHPGYGTLGTRFHRVLVPLALAQVPVQAVSLVVTVLVAIVTPLRNQGVAGLGAAFVGLLTLLAGIYSLILFIQSGAVGSNLNRWAVLGIAILASIIVAALVSVIVLPFAIIGATTH